MKTVFLLPGQGAQYPGMAKDFYEQFAIVRQTFEEADDTLGRSLTTIIFEGPVDTLTETVNSQTAIYVVSVALTRLLESLFPNLQPSYCAGLSLGEYSALTAAGKLSFSDGLPLVQTRGRYMNDACLERPGTMAVVLGLNGSDVEAAVTSVGMPDELWAANFNCPGQVVISGTPRGVAAGSKAVLAKGAKRVLPLQVQGAFHSGLMRSAEERLGNVIRAVSLQETLIGVLSNVTGKIAATSDEIKDNLIKQVCAPVRWEQSIAQLENIAVDSYVEIGPGKTLSSLNKRIGVKAPTYSIEKISDLDAFTAA